MQSRYFALSAAGILCGLFVFSSYSQAQTRIQGAVSDQHTITLTGNHHPLARPEFDAGPVAPDFVMGRMILALQPSADRASALDALLAAQQDPSSPQYHQWLTPDEFASQFGVSQTDLQQVTQWLNGHGFTIEEVPAGSQSIVFSGTAAQVETAFHTSIHSYNVGGKTHHANATDPQIPEALAGVIAGAVSLHDFQRKPLHARIESAPAYTTGTTHYLAPGDFATIYDVTPLYSSFKGTGQTIAIAGRTNIMLSDVQTFRSTFGLPTNNPVIVVNGTNPGIVSTDEVSEADLDVEWSGAVAPLATVKFVVSASTSTTDGIDLSSQYIVSNNLAPVMSVSFGSCELQMGSAERAFYNNLWQQAASQGITVMVAAGDSGAAGCDAPSETTATGGQAINGLCSTTYSVCVGGTEFDENGNNNIYWSSSDSSTLSSALTYIPETAWNESGANGGSYLWATGGGASAYYTKPVWQSGPGVPADSKRDVPDVSLTAAGHDGYLTNIQGNWYIVSGTSAASPSFAGLMALVDQKTAARQGNINSILYPLAALQASGGAAVLHAPVGGNNTVPGVTGFTVGPHYNQATGLGSPDALLLANHWTDASSGPAYSVSSTSAVSVTRGAQATASVNVTVSGGFSSAVALSITGMPSGVSASFAPASFNAPGSGTSTLTLSTTTSVVPGPYSLTVTATAGSQTKTASVTLTVNPQFTVTTVSSISITRGASAPVTVTTQANSGFSGAIALTAQLPSGVTAAFAPASIASPGNGTSQLTLTVASSATPGTYAVTITGTSGSVVQTASLSLTIPQQATFTLSAAPSTVNVTPPQSAATTISATSVNGFSGSIMVSHSTLPHGVTAVWSSSSSGAVLTFTASTAASPGSYPITITGTNPNVSQSPTATVTLVVK